MRGSANVKAGTAVGLGAAAAVGLLLVSACGTGAGAPDGWRTLEAGQVSVSYPKGKGWRQVKSRDEKTASVVLKRDGKDVAKIAVKLRFRKGGDTGVAAVGSMAPLQPGAKIKRSARLTIDGREAERVDYTYQASSASEAEAGRGIPEGALVEGVDLVTTDVAGAPLLVRINAAEGTVSDTEFDQIVNSVSLT